MHRNASRCGLRGHDHAATATRADSLYRIAAGPEQDGAAAYAVVPVEPAIPLAHLIHLIGGEPLRELPLEFAADAGDDDIGVDEHPRLPRERLHAGADTRAGVDQRHVEIESDGQHLVTSVPTGDWRGNNPVRPIFLIELETGDLVPRIDNRMQSRDTRSERRLTADLRRRTRSP